MPLGFDLARRRLGFPARGWPSRRVPPGGWADAPLSLSPCGRGLGEGTGAKRRPGPRSTPAKVRFADPSLRISPARGERPGRAIRTLRCPTVLRLFYPPAMADSLTLWPACAGMPPFLFMPRALVGGWTPQRQARFVGFLEETGSAAKVTPGCGLPETKGHARGAGRPGRPGPFSRHLAPQQVRPRAAKAERFRALAPLAPARCTCRPAGMGVVRWGR